MLNNERFEYLAQNYPVVKRFNSLMKKTMALVHATGLEDDLVVNEDILGRVVIDYFEDIDRLKRFEGIDRIAVSKIYAYQTFWLCRRKPIQTRGKEVSDERCIFINEIVFSLMLISDMYSEMGKNPPSGNEELGRFYDLLYYNMKYRKMSQKNIEIMIEAFFLGCSSCEVDS